MTAQREPRYAYEDPAALAWFAQLLRTGRRRLAAEQAREDANATEGRTGRATDA